MLGIHVRKQVLKEWDCRASISDPRSTRDQLLGDNTPRIITLTGGKRSCPGAGPDNTTYPAGEAVPLEDSSMSVKPYLWLPQRH